MYGYLLFYYLITAGSWAYDFENQSSGHAILYNISSLGQTPRNVDEPTKVHYEQKIDIKEPTDNRRGSVLTLMNGNIHSIGNVGGVSALGWSGTRYNETVGQPATENHGLSGVWLAFTSSQAIAGGYSLTSKGLTTSNNVNVGNVTLRSNFTLALPEQEQGEETGRHHGKTRPASQLSWGGKGTNETLESKELDSRNRWTFTFSLPNPSCQASTNENGEWTMTCVGRV